MKKKRLEWAIKHKEWTEEAWIKVVFSDESHFYVQGHNTQYVRRSNDEPICKEHLIKTVKHPEKNVLGLLQHYKSRRISPH